jgi:hypothetical protein
LKGFGYRRIADIGSPQEVDTADFRERIFPESTCQSCRAMMNVILDRSHHIVDVAQHVVCDLILHRYLINN